MALRIEQVTTFDGPNLWFERPIVRAVLTGSVAAVEDRLLNFQTRIEQFERDVDRTRFEPRSLPPAPERLEAPWLLAWAAVGLQRLAGDDVVYFAARALESAGANEIVVECLHQQTGILALRIALQHLDVVAGANRERLAMDLQRDFTRRLVPVAKSRRPTAELACMLAAARARGIPITSLDPRGLIRELGHGVYRRRLRHSSTSNTSYIGTLIARDKQLSLHYLAACGAPVPETFIARDAAQAIAHARAIGFPVVIKPNDEGNSAGVHLDLRDDDEVGSAFADAARISRSGTVVVQRYLTERHYRVLVAGDRIVGIAERIAAHVIGDGRHSIRELVDIENQHPRRGTRKADRLKTIVIDETTDRLLKKQGLTLDDVPPRGVQVNLQRIDDLETGGEAIMQTVAAHPDNERIIISAVRAMELDIAGVDLVATDIGQSIWETTGGILEVNCDTGFALIQFPTSEGAIDPGPAVIETLFPLGAPVRVPLVVVTGDRDTSEVSRLTGRLMTAAGHSVGIAVQDGLYLGETRLAGIDSSGVHGKRRVLLDPAVEMAVLEISPEEIVTEGLAFEQCDVAVITALSDSPNPGWPPVESVVVQTLTTAGVLVAPGDDPAVVRYLQELTQPAILYATTPCPALETHLRAGGRAVMLRNDAAEPALVIFDGSDPAGTHIPQPTVPFTSEPGLAAIAVLLALGNTPASPRNLIRQIGPSTPV